MMKTALHRENICYYFKRSQATVKARFSAANILTVACGRIITRVFGTFLCNYRNFHRGLIWGVTRSGHVPNIPNIPTFQLLDHYFVYFDDLRRSATGLDRGCYRCYIMDGEREKANDLLFGMATRHFQCVYKDLMRNTMPFLC